MKRLIILIFITIYVFSFSQLSTTEAIDTINIGRFNIILYNNFSWKYENHDSAMSILAIEDSIKLFNYIKENKFLSCDNNILEYNWDTAKFLAETETNYKIYEDTLLIDLLCSGNFVCPHNGKITSRFGWRWGRLHQGIDIQLYTGDTIVAAFDGKVRYTGRYYGYGNAVVIRGNNGLETIYAHLSKINCYKNQVINAGEVIGLGGTTGRVTGPHLHFEIRYKNTPINPELIVDFNKHELINPKFLIMPQYFSELKKANEAQYHTIQNGDTLGRIASKYHSTINNICTLNGISQNKLLQIGTTLRVR